MDDADSPEGNYNINPFVPIRQYDSLFFWYDLA